MTFSFNVKDEVTRVEASKAECIAELSAIIRNSGDITDNLQVHIENNAVARRIYKLIKIEKEPIRFLFFFVYIYSFHNQDVPQVLVEADLPQV